MSKPRIRVDKDATVALGEITYVCYVDIRWYAGWGSTMREAWEEFCGINDLSTHDGEPL